MNSLILLCCSQVEAQKLVIEEKEEECAAQRMRFESYREGGDIVSGGNEEECERLRVELEEAEGNVEGLEAELEEAQREKREVVEGKRLMEGEVGKLEREVEVRLCDSRREELSRRYCVKTRH